MGYLIKQSPLHYYQINFKTPLKYSQVALHAVVVARTLLPLYVKPLYIVTSEG